MPGTRETLHAEAFDAIDINWPQIQGLLVAARSCLDRYHNELNNLNVPGHEPSNQEISNFLHHLAQKIANTPDIVPQNTDQSVYVPNCHQGNFTAEWVYSPGPWNPLQGLRSQDGAEKTDTSSPTIRSELLQSIPLIEINPGNATDQNTQLYPHTSQPHSTLRTEPQALETLNSSSLTQTQLLRHGTNSSTYQPINERKNGRSSIAFSTGASQYEFPWSNESFETAITTPTFQGKPNKRSHQAVLTSTGPLSTSSKSLEDECSHSGSHEQVGNATAGVGIRRQQRLTYAEAARRPVQGVIEPGVSPATSTNGSTMARTRYICEYEDCDKSFDWEWKYKDHLKMHTKEKPFACLTCNTHFGRDRDLVKHRQSQKHKKNLSNQSATPSGDTESRPLTPAVRSPRSFSRASRGIRLGREQTLRGRRSRAESVISGRRGTSVATASVADSGEMDLTGETDDDESPRGIAQPPSDPIDEARKPNKCTSPTRSVKRMRTVGDFDINTKHAGSIQAAGNPDTESFGSPVSPANSRLTLSPTRSNHAGGFRIPYHPAENRKTNLQSHMTFMNNANSFTLNMVQGLPLNSSFHQSATMNAAESPNTEWMPADDRMTVAPVITTSDDYTQYIDYDPPHTMNASSSPAWSAGGNTVIIPSNLAQDFRRHIPDYFGARSDGG